MGMNRRYICKDMEAYAGGARPAMEADGMGGRRSRNGGKLQDTTLKGYVEEENRASGGHRCGGRRATEARRWDGRQRSAAAHRRGRNGGGADEGTSSFFFFERKEQVVEALVGSAGNKRHELWPVGVELFHLDLGL